MKEYVRLTIKDLQARLTHTEKQFSEIKQTIRVLSELEGVPIVPLPAEIIPPGPLPGPVPEPAEDKGARSPLPPRKGKRFKGVMKTASGRYQAICWDSKACKTLHLGTFTDEIEAALAVAERLGDKVEIERFEELVRQKADEVEQRENNPDRTPKKTGETGNGTCSPRKDVRADRRQDRKEKAEIGKERSRKGVGTGRRHNYSMPHKSVVKSAVKKDIASATADKSQISESGDPPQSELVNMGGLLKANVTACAWQCRKCGHHHLQELIPENCANCNSDEGFRKIE
jgi:rubrerythrin